MKKRRVLAAEKRERVLLRQHEVHVLYPAFVERWVLDPEDRFTMPNCQDINGSPEVIALIDESDAQLAMTAEHLDSAAEALLRHADGHRVRVRRDLVAIMAEGWPQDEPRLEFKLNDDEWVSQQASRASSLWVHMKELCSERNREFRVCGYPEILRTDAVQLRSWSAAKSRLLSGASVSLPRDEREIIHLNPIARAVLQAVGLPEDTTRAAVQNLQFTCTCGQGIFAGSKPSLVGFTEMVLSRHSALDKCFAPTPCFLGSARVKRDGGEQVILGV